MREIVSPLSGFRSPFGQRLGGGVAPFSPLSLFASGEEGVWYEPSTTTAFRSTTDLTPCGYGETTGQCGFLLDKSQGAGYSGGSFTGLGSELVTNGTFDTDTDWTKTGNWSISGGQANSGSTSGDDDIQQDVGFSAGKLYKIGIEVISLSNSRFSDRVFFSFGDGDVQDAGRSFASVGITSTGSHTFYAFAGSVDSILRIYAGAFTTLVIDNISVRELPGNHATQGNADARPILARVPETGVRNIIDQSGDLEDASWSKNSATVTAVSDYFELIPAASSATHVIFKTVANSNLQNSTQYTISIEAKANGYGFLAVANGNTSADGDYTVFDLSDGSVDQESAGASGSSVPLGDGWFRLSMTGTSATSNSQELFSVVSQAGASVSGIGAETFTGDGTSGVLIRKPQSETGASETDYQERVSEYDITEAGVTSLDYLSFDGVDDGMATASIDFTSTDEMSVFAGFGKVVDELDIITELSNDSTANAGVFSLFANGASGGYSWRSRGSASPSIAVSTSDPAPSVNVLTGLGDISADQMILRVDGAQEATSTGDQGAGNFGSYPLWIGKRGDTAAVNLEGNLYGLIVRGASSDATEISNTETYLANRSGVSL